MSSSAQKKKMEEKHRRILMDLLQVNRNCADCGTKGPRWATHIGAFICINCAGHHRNLGVHISKVKSVTLDSWTPEQIKNISELGNEAVNSCYEGRLPSQFCRPGPSDFNLENFIRAKYERKEFMVGEAPKRTTSSSSNNLASAPAFEQQQKISSSPRRERRQPSASAVPSLVGEDLFGAMSAPVAPISDNNNVSQKHQQNYQQQNQQQQLSGSDLFGASPPKQQESLNNFGFSSGPPSPQHQRVIETDNLFGTPQPQPQQQQRQPNLIDNDIFSSPPSQQSQQQSFPEQQSISPNSWSNAEPQKQKSSNEAILSLYNQGGGGSGGYQQTPQQQIMAMTQQQQRMMMMQQQQQHGQQFNQMGSMQPRTQMANTRMNSGMNGGLNFGAQQQMSAPHVLPMSNGMDKRHGYMNKGQMGHQQLQQQGWNGHMTNQGQQRPPVMGTGMGGFVTGMQQVPQGMVGTSTMNNGLWK